MSVWVRNMQDRPSLPAPLLQRVAAVVFDALGAQPASVGVGFVDDSQMIAAHAAYLGDDSTTDVLSFPGDGQDDEAYCGDIMICTDQARRQAIALQHPYEHELMVLFLHGLLHLLGFDHTRDHGEMRSREEALRPRCMAAGALP